MLVLQIPDELEPQTLQCNPLMEARVWVFISLPEEHCVPLVIKKLGRQMLKDVFREELESLVIVSRESCSSVWDHDQDAYKGRPLTTHLIW